LGDPLLDDSLISPDLKVCRLQVMVPHPHFRRNESNRQTIADSMRRDGWSGRPLLTHEHGPSLYQAWTGMHRLLAAEDAGLSEVPIVVMTRDQLNSIGLTDDLIDNDPYLDPKLQKLLARLPDSRPYRLMELERKRHATRGF
jgi:ParB-like chromosome segregation protein Spo0J